MTSIVDKEEMDMRPKKGEEELRLISLLPIKLLFRNHTTQLDKSFQKNQVHQKKEKNKKTILLRLLLNNSPKGLLHQMLIKRIQIDSKVHQVKKGKHLLIISKLKKI
jgi:hypothetical protein